MKTIYEFSKKQFLDKLEYTKKILAVMADITRSFATIIGSTVAGVTAGVTGYFEIKKVFKKERLIIKASKTESSSKEVRAGVTTTTSTTVSTPGSSEMVSAPYAMDMNSASFLVSILILGFLAFSKLRKKK